MTQNEPAPEPPDRPPGGADPPAPALDCIAERARGAERLVPWMLSAAFALLVAGVVLPVVRVDEFYIFTDRLSLLDAVRSLYADGEVLLAGVVAAFSMVFPVLKLALAGYVWAACPVGPHGTGRALDLLGWVGRWSMLDVLVVGLVVVSIKASGLATAESEPGLYLFAAAVMTSAAAVWLLRRAERRLRRAAM